MDYCDPCRRHLNGALACPGCGTTLEELRAQTYAQHSGLPPYEDGHGGAYDGHGD
ncbi:SCO2400 family protein, partial [Streptomyces sp. NPDC001759]